MTSCAVAAVVATAAVEARGFAVKARFVEMERFVVLTQGFAVVSLCDVLCSQMKT